MVLTTREKKKKKKKRKREKRERERGGGEWKLTDGGMKEEMKGNGQGSL